MVEILRDAIVFSTWSWEVFNAPERIALALASRRRRVLYTEMPVSRFRRNGKPPHQVAPGVYSFAPTYIGSKLNSLPVAGSLQWKIVAQQVIARANELKLKDPWFLYSHVDGIAPLCKEMRSAGFPLIHICMDYPEPYQDELIELSDQTLVIPKSVFRDLQAKYGTKIAWIPQSIHLPARLFGAEPLGKDPHAEPDELRAVPRPRLGYLGPIFARINLPVLRELLERNPGWHFVYFGKSKDLDLSNAHGMSWHSPEELPAFVASFDVGLMPYDCSDKKNLHCSPLKLYDYFLAGLPVVATPILELAEFQSLTYSGETASELSEAILHAIAEPKDSPKRGLRVDVARAHSTEALGLRLEEVLGALETRVREKR
jgi:Glycosyl transferases group 1